MLLTRLPVPVRLTAPRGARAAWAWPLAGAVVAALAAGVAAGALALGLPPGVAAGLALAVGVLMTGALHEDGLADTADGLWGGHTRERRLEILRDSRIGTYGVVALVLVIGLRWQALVALAAEPWDLVAAAVLSRAAMAGVAWALPHARPDGLSAATGRPPGGAVALGAVVAAGLALGLAGPAALWAGLAAGLAAAGIARVARARIGGQTGDILGASQQLAEVAALLALLAVAA